MSCRCKEKETCDDYEPMSRFDESLDRLEDVCRSFSVFHCKCMKEEKNSE